MIACDDCEGHGHGHGGGDGSICRGVQLKLFVAERNNRYCELHSHLALDTY